MVVFWWGVSELVGVCFHLPFFFFVWEMAFSFCQVFVIWVLLVKNREITSEGGFII